MLLVKILKSWMYTCQCMNLPYHMHLHQEGVPGGLGLCRGVLPDRHSGGGSSLTAGEKRILGQCIAMSLSV